LRSRLKIHRCLLEWSGGFGDGSTAKHWKDVFEICTLNWRHRINTIVILPTVIYTITTTMKPIFVDHTSTL
jgi:hypothetical protein